MTIYIFFVRMVVLTNLFFYKEFIFMGPINQRLNFQIISNQYQDILSIIDTGDTEKLKSFLNKTSSSNLPIVLNKTYHAMSVMSVLVIILSYENIEG